MNNMAHGLLIKFGGLLPFHLVGHWLYCPTSITESLFCKFGMFYLKGKGNINHKAIAFLKNL